MWWKNAGVRTVCVLMIVGVGGCAGTGPPSPPAAELGVRFEVVDNLLPVGNRFSALLTLENRGPVPLPGEGWEVFFNFGGAIDGTTLPSSVTVTHVNGDFWRLEPTAEMAPVAPGASLEIPFEGYGSVTKESAAPAGFYIVFYDDDRRPLPPVAITDFTIAPFESVRQTSRGPAENLPVPTPASRYEEQRALELLPDSEVARVVPTPVAVEQGSGTVAIDASWSISHQPGLEREAAELGEALEQLLGEALAVTASGEEAQIGDSPRIVLEVGEVSVAGRPKEPGDEAYRLSLDENGVRVTGTDAAGVFYGLQSLEALIPITAWERSQPTLELETLTIEDAPRFGYRGLHLDVARNFQSPETVERLLELASFYKLNRFHFHLSDDEGWRMAVEELPELVEVGGRRGHTVDELDHLIPSYGSGPDPDNSLGSGHYSRAEIIELLRYARERHIQVIPEIDLPGHARAAIKAMESRSARMTADGRPEEAERFRLRDPGDRSEYRSVQGWDDNVVDVCLESTYLFVETVVDEIVEIWGEAEAPLEVIHIGGDEVPRGVWTASPACDELIAANDQLEGVEDLAGYFLSRVNEMLTARGLQTGGWEEIALAEKLWEGHQVKAPDPTLLGRGLRPYVWNNVWGWGAEDLGYRLANTGYDVVLCGATNLYFDLAYDRDPREPGYSWAGFVDTRKAWELVPFDVFKNASHDLMGNPLPSESGFADRVRPTAEGRARILGIQGQLWAENSKGRDVLEYQAFPKLLGLAERAWAAQPAWARIESRPERERRQAVAWNEFANRLGQRELPRLDRMLGGVAYRLPPPGAVVEEGVMHASAAFPGLAVRYSADGEPPSSESPLYQGPVEVDGEVQLAVFDTRGRSSRVATVAP